MKKLLKKTSDWFGQPIEGISGAIRLFIMTFIVLPLFGFVIYLVFAITGGLISYVFKIDSGSNYYEGVCGDGGRYDPDC